MLDETARAGSSGAGEPTTPDAVEIAMEAEATGVAPEGAARRLLESHIRLADEQIGLARNERFRNRIKAVRDMTLAAAVMLLVLGLGAVLLAARNAQGLVVEPLGVPPEMAAQGMDGSVLAARLLDRLSAMQAATDSSRAPSSYSNNWGDDLEVEVPQTGMSAGEIWGALRAGLGRETRVTGDVVRNGDGLAITVRVGAQPGVTVSGPAADLDRLLDQSAEAAYRRSQPYRYAVWLNRTRGGGNAQILDELAASTDKTERLWALVGQSVNALAVGDPVLAEALARQALEMDPTFHKARWNVTDALAVMGRDEDLLADNRLTERAMRRRDPRVTEASQGQVLHGARSTIADMTGDYATAAAEARIQTGLPDYSNNGVNAHYYAAESRIRLHDVSGARRARAPVDGTARALPDAALLVDYVAASERGDAAAVQRLGAEVVVLLATPDGAGSVAYWAPDLAPVLARMEDAAAVERLLSAPGTDCYRCAIAQGKIAELKGDRAGADRWFARAVRMGPSLVRAEQAWGEAKLKRGDRAGAIALFRQAAEKGPRWADPLKGWGDALQAGGDGRGAIAKYRAAARLAPRWGALQLAWGRALEADGKRDEALEKYRAAAGMDLTPLDRAEVNRRRASAAG